MPAERKLPGGEVVKGLYESGVGIPEIAQEYEVTPAAVYGELHRAGVRFPPPPKTGLMPEGMSREQMHSPVAKVIRIHAKIKAGKDVTPAEQLRLDNFTRKLKETNQIVDFEPGHAPNPASPTYGGWFLAKRTEEDGPGWCRWWNGE